MNKFYKTQKDKELFVAILCGFTHSVVEGMLDRDLTEEECLTITNSGLNFVENDIELTIETMNIVEEYEEAGVSEEDIDDYLRQIDEERNEL